MTPKRENQTEALRRQRRKKQRRKKQRRRTLLKLAALTAVVLLAVLLIPKLVGGDDDMPTEPSETTRQTEETTQAYEEYTVIHIAAAGDLNVTDKIVSAGAAVSGYRFDQTFLDVAPILGAADLTVLNFEGTLAGVPYGTATGSAPPELVTELVNIGVDAVQTANSASIRSGVLGLQSTISGLQDSGLVPIGTFANNDAYEKSGGYTILEVGGIRVALVAFTKGMDNLGLPESSENCVNLLYNDYTTDYKQIDTEGINAVLERIREEAPDLTIAMLHWGSEYNENISTSQKTIRDLMLRGGVDVILGSHSHLLQSIEFDEEKGTLVAWSLGDFYGDADKPASNYSAILDIEVTRDNELGTTSVTGFTTTPIFTLQDSQSIQGGHRVVQLEKAIARYESVYMGRVTSETYESMQYALKRVGQRIAGE